MDQFVFAEDVESYKKDNAFVATIDAGIKSEKELFNLYEERLEFPYFGHNWNALSDCLADLDWISDREIIIIHDDVPELANWLKVYVEILQRTIEHWHEWDDEHRITVVFPASAEAEVRPFLK